MARKAKAGLLSALVVLLAVGFGFAVSGGIIGLVVGIALVAPYFKEIYARLAGDK